jgi:hypothetical protein
MQFKEKLTDYQRTIIGLRADGIQYVTFINDDGNMVIRHNSDFVYDANAKNYEELIYNPAAKLIKVVSVENNYTHVQGGED